MFAILGEDKSDVEMLCTLVRRIAKKPNLPVKKMGYMGCAELLIKGAKQIKAYSKIGCTRFIICYDSDRSRASDRYSSIIDKIIRKSEVTAEFCALVPVQEIEAWILADLASVTKIIPSWKPSKGLNSPEFQNDPKEYLERLSRNAQHKPLYSHAVHNPKVAAHISLEQIVRKCPSAFPLFEIVQGSGGNYPMPTYQSEALRRGNILAAL
jgi:hypothetical protein